jgi:hypothetical protein
MKMIRQQYQQYRQYIYRVRQEDGEKTFLVSRGEDGEESFVDMTLTPIPDLTPDPITKKAFEETIESLFREIEGSFSEIKSGSGKTVALSNWINNIWGDTEGDVVVFNPNEATLTSVPLERREQE